MLQRRSLLIFLSIALLGWWMGYAPCRATLVADCLETTGGHFMEIREFNPKAPLGPEPRDGQAAGPIAGVQYALADAYDKSGQTRNAGSMFLNAAQSALAEKDIGYALQIIDKLESSKDHFHLSTGNLHKIELLRKRTGASNQ